MALSLTQMNADYAAILGDTHEAAATADFGVDSAVPCNKVSMLARDMAHRGEGFQSAYRFSLAFQASDFTTAPVDGDELTYDGTVWRVIGTDGSPDAVELRTHLADRYSNAL